LYIYGDIGYFLTSIVFWVKRKYYWKEINLSCLTYLLKSLTRKMTINLFFVVSYFKSSKIFSIDRSFSSFLQQRFYDYSLNMRILFFVYKIDLFGEIMLKLFKNLLLLKRFFVWLFHAQHLYLLGLRVGSLNGWQLKKPCYFVLDQLFWIFFDSLSTGT